MPSIQSPVLPQGAPPASSTGSAPHAEEASPDRENAFAEVLRGKQNPPRREAPAEPGAPALPGAEASEADPALPVLDTSSLPPDLAAALAQIGAMQGGQPRGLAPNRQAPDAGAMPGAAGADDIGRRIAVLDPGASAPDAAALRTGVPGTAEGAIPGASAEARPAQGAETLMPGARLSRADGVIARSGPAVAPPPAEPAPAARTDALPEKSILEALKAGRAGAGVDTSAPAPATGLPAWAAAAVPVDQGAARVPVAPPHVTTIDAPVGSQRFADQAAQQVTWMAKNGLSEAEIRVKPAELGPISVRIEMNQNEAVINFAVTQPETRAAVQDSLHRLEEMLAESGISLGEANVGDQNQARQSGDRPSGGSSRSRVTFSAGGADGVAALPPVPRGRTAAIGLVDTFA